MSMIVCILMAASVKLKNLPFILLVNDLNRHKERHGSEYKRLIGHSGPVYGLSFSHDNKYLISCSEDKTGLYSPLGSSMKRLIRYYSTIMEHTDIFQPCVLQRPQLPNLGCRLWTSWILLCNGIQRSNSTALEL